MAKFLLPDGGTLTYLKRSDWDNSGARRLGYVIPETQIERLVMHHTVSVWEDQPAGIGDEIARMRYLRTVRPDLGEDVPYSFVLFRQHDPRSVVVAEGRGFGRTGAHTAGHNSTVYGVALAGNFENDPWTLGLEAGVCWIGSQLTNPKAAKAHRDYKATACCGQNAYDRLPDVQPPYLDPTQIEDDDMALTKHQVEALFVQRLEQIYRHTGPNYREPEPTAVSDWLELAREPGADLDELLGACEWLLGTEGK